MAGVNLPTVLMLALLAASGNARHVLQDAGAQSLAGARTQSGPEGTSSEAIAQSIASGDAQAGGTPGDRGRPHYMEGGGSAGAAAIAGAGADGSQAAGQALAQTAAQGGGQAQAAAKAVAQAAQTDPDATASAVSQALAQAQSSGNPQAVAQALSQAVSEGGDSAAKAVAQAYAQSVNQGNTGAAAQAIAQGAATGGSDADAQAQALAQALATGGGTAEAVAQATAEAYASQPAPVANALANALTQANNNAGQLDEAARIVARALLAGGNSARVFADALAAAIGKGGCGAVNNILQKLEAAASQQGAGADALVQALASNNGAAVVRCLYPSCANQFNIGTCCAQAGSPRCACFGSFCQFRRVVQSPLVWEANLSRRRCACA
ncbi:MAG: hypothetical protein J3K34DRAFT_489259 [Monoraphidium minutum]|nr:MAG: hypothetical protein J3K34DRAFT_489259 [Monoraphidium minutum]